MTAINLSNLDQSLDKTSQYFDRSPYHNMLVATAGSVTSDELIIEDFRNFTFFVVCTNDGSSTTSGTVYIEAQIKPGDAWLIADTTTLSGVDAIKQVSGPFYAFRARTVSVSAGVVDVTMRAQR